MAPSWMVVYRGLLLVAVLLGVFLVAKAIEHRDKPGGTPLLGLAAGALLYVGVKLAVSTVRGTPTVFLFTRGNVLGSGLATLGFVLFAVEFTGLETPVSNRTVGLLSAEPLLASSLVLIDARFFWVPVGREASTVSGYTWELTSIAIANQLYMTLLLILGVLLLVRFAVGSADVFTTQALALIVAGSAQVAGNASFYLGYVPFNPTPIVFVLSGILVAWVIIDKRLLDLVPVGRDAIVNDLDAGVVTIDSSHRVIDVNPAARRLFRFEADEQLVGKPLAEAFEGYPQFRALYWSGTDHDTGQAATLEFEDRHFEVEQTTLIGEDDTVFGCTMLVRDVTERMRREQALEQAFELNKAIQQIAVEARTRDEVELAFCRRLTDEPGRRSAWVGQPNDADVLEPRVVAGPDEGYLETVELDLTQQSGPPSGQAITTGTPTFLSNLNDEPETPWRNALTARGIKSVAAIPLVHDDISFGVLTVYATEPEGFTESGRELLLDIAETLSASIERAELRTALTADRVIEVELQFSSDEYYLFPVVRALDGDTADPSVEVLATIPHDEYGVWQFLSVSPVENEKVRSKLSDQRSVEMVECIDTADREVVFRVHVDEEPPESQVGDLGGVVRRSEVTSSFTTIVAEFSENRDVRSVVETLEEAFGPVSLKRYQKRDVEREQSTVLNRCDLTEKQATALRTAYQYGYFEDTREYYAEEIAQALNVSRATFQRHLRIAQRKVFNELLSDEQPD